MNGLDLRAARKKAAMTQHELAEALDVSRKTVISWEQSDKDLDEGVTLKALKAIGSIRLLEDTYRVETTQAGDYAVVGRRVRDLPSRDAMVWLHSELRLFGVFKRRDHAYRWQAALVASADPRDTRKLARERLAEVSAAAA